MTTGAAWKSLRLAGRAVTFDTNEFMIAEPNRIAGALAGVLSAD